MAKRDGTSYFEKICLRGDVDGCRDKAWSFERVIGMRLDGYDGGDGVVIEDDQDTRQARQPGSSCEDEGCHTWIG